MYLELDLDSIPTLETSRMRIFHVLEDETADVDDVLSVVSSDPAMAAKIIKLANSPFYRHSDNGVALHDAILTIGFDMVKCITLSMAVMGSFGGSSEWARRLWLHSYAVALISMEYANDKDEKDWIFTGGLLHDLGRMVILDRAPAEYIELYRENRSWPLPSVERQAFEMDHTQVGEYVASRWHFPSQVTGVIRDHHSPANRMSAIVYTADKVVHHEVDGEDIDLYNSVGFLRGFLGPDYKKLVDGMVSGYKKNTSIIRSLV